MTREEGGGGGEGPEGNSDWHEHSSISSHHCMLVTNIQCLYT